MIRTPRWLQQIRQRNRAAGRAAHNASESKPRSARILTWIAVATLGAAVIGIFVTWHYGRRSDATEIQEQYSRVIDQTLKFLPQMRAAEERTSARVADIQAALKRPELTVHAKDCLEGLRINATGELDAIQSINRKLNELVFNWPLGPPSDMSASDLTELRRRQNVTVELFAGHHAERYAQFKSTRVHECIEGTE